MTGCDILVAGGGPAGLAAAALQALAGRRVVVATGRAATGEDPRTVALMQPQVRLLGHLGVWPGTLAAAVAPLNRLRMVDDTGSPGHRAPTISFDPHEIDEDVFGWNFPLAVLVPALVARCRDLGVRLIEAEVTGAQAAADAIAVATSIGSFEARLAIAADGRRSVLREAAGLACRKWTYDQAALATSFAHSAPHDGVSTEYHRPAGPFTTVPLPGLRASLVWMERPARAAELMAMTDAELAVEIQIASHGELGRISAIGPRKLFAMEGLIATSFAARRTLLIGETAHVVPPIGAQGLNMSLRDAAQAAELMEGRSDPGAADILHDYDVARRRDVLPRQQAIDLMNRSLLSGLLPLEMGRALGLELVSRFGPLRRYVMRRGLGPVSSLPKVMAEAE